MRTRFGFQLTPKQKKILVITVLAAVVAGVLIGWFLFPYMSIRD